jgi:hypothetical protein
MTADELLARERKLEELARVALLRHMEYMSEEYLGAGWHRDCSVFFWLMMHKPKPAQSDSTRADFEALKGFHELAAGWYVWDRRKHEAVFLTTEEWKKHPTYPGESK